MAGIRAEDADAFSEMMLANTQGGYVPEYAPMPAPGPTMGDQAAELLSKLQGAAPTAGRLGPYMPGVDGAQAILGGLSNPMSAVGGMVANPDATQRALERGGLLPPPPREMTSFQRTHDAETDLRPMNTPLADVRSAPTLQEQAREQVAQGAGLGGGGGGNGLRSRWEQAQQEELRQMGLGSDLAREQGINQSLRTDMVSDREDQDAARMQRDAANQQQIDHDAATKHDAFLARQQTLADDLAKKQIDPSRLLRNADAQTQFTIGLGAALGGGNAMLNGSNGNSSLDRLDKLIDRDIQSQIQDIDSAKASFSARSSLFGQMMQETGDQRLAAMQTRSLIYEGMKLKLKSDAARLGIPELRTSAEILANGIDQKKAALDEQMRGQALKMAQAQAQAAASARAAAERLAHERLMDLAKLNLEQQKIDASREGKSGDLNRQTQSLGDKLGDKDLAEGRGAVDAAKRRLQSLAPDEGLPGVSRSGDFRAGLKPEGANLLNPIAYAANATAGLSDSERVSRSDWAKMKAAYIKQISGSGVSAGERKILEETFEGARTPAEQRNAVAQANKYFEDRESAIKAGFDPAAVELFESRRSSIRPQLPSGAKEKR